MMKTHTLPGRAVWLIAVTLAATSADALGQDAIQFAMTSPEGALVQLVPHSGPGIPVQPPGTPGNSFANAWQPASVPPGLFLRAICAATPSIAYAVGELGVVLKSTDGGASWQTILDDGFPYYWYGCQATSAQSVVISGFNNQTGEGILRWSENGGASFGPILVLPGPTSGVQWLDRIEFSNVSDGLVSAGWSGGVHSTQNGGRQASDWSYTQLSGAWFSGTFTFHPDGRAWIAGVESVFTPDGGASWAQFPVTSAPFNGPVSIHNHGFGFTGGGTISPTVDGWIYRTHNGGHEWTPSPVASLPYPVRGLLALDAQHAWAVGGDYYSGAGGIWSSTDGVNWSLDQDTGSELLDIDWIRIDNSKVRVLVAGIGSQIWHATIDCPVNAGVVATAYGFCDYSNAPCGNVYDNAGCQNMTGEGALLAASGTSSITNDDLVLEVTQLPANKLGVLFMGPGQQEMPAGNGMLAVAAGGTGLHRFPVHMASSSGVLTEGPGIAGFTNAHFPLAAQIQPGQAWNFQAYYRDPSGPCGQTYNFSNGFSVTFLP